MRVCIVGGGNVGFYLAKTLSENGHAPVLIDENPALCRRVADSLDLTVVCGDGWPRCRRARVLRIAARWPPLRGGTRSI